MTAIAYLRNSGLSIFGVIMLSPNVVCMEEDFINLFGSTLQKAIDDGTSVYDALVATDGSPNNLGYKTYFDAWKQQGLLT